MLDNRKMQILREILHASGGISVKHLEEKIKVSRRTIYYDLESINYWLETSGLDEIRSSRQVGFFVDEKERTAIESLLPAINDYEYEPSMEERVALMILLITTTDAKYGVQELSEHTRVSRTTCLKDLKACDQTLSPFDVSLDYHRARGYSIKGKEVDVRKAIAYALSMLLDHFHAELLNEKLKTALTDHKGMDFSSAIAFFKNLLTFSESILERTFNDRMFRFISYYFALVLFRIRRGLVADYPLEESQEVQGTKGAMAAQLMKKQIEEAFDCHLPQGETTHLAIQLLCASLDTYFVHQPNDLSEKIKHDIIPKFIHDFETVACVDFQEKEKLAKNLYLHFLPAYYRTLYQIPLENPVKEEIMTEFADLFFLTRRALVDTESILGLTFNDSEAAYFAMHFGSFFKNQGIALDTKSIAIVCPSGIATSNFIAKQIINLLPDECHVRTYSTREFEEKNPPVDLVISTSFLTDRRDTIHVNPVITTDDKKRILDQLGYKRKAFYKSEIVHDLLSIVEKHTTITDMKALHDALKDYFSEDLTLHEEVKYKPMLSELITKEHIQLSKKVTDWKEALHLACQPLLSRQYIEESYIEAMIQTVITVGPYFVIMPKIAIPHARPEDGVNKLCMSLLKLDEGVYFDPEKPESKAHLLFVLAAEDNSTHLKALSQLTTLLSDEGEVQALIDAQDVKEILAVIENY